MRCFNPCCVGSPSPSAREESVVASSKGFNPCCVGSPSPSPACSDDCSPANGFQSLLCWITQSFDVANDAGRARCSGFNPCCVGSPSPSTFMHRIRADNVEFQSLLCWITQSFYGRGCISRPDRIVSIPVVLDHPVLRVGPVGQSSADHSVSIPVVLDHPVLPSQNCALTVPLKLFQSLLCWITQSFAGTGQGRCSGAGVSIPVVLDHPVLLPDRDAGCQHLVLVSIPVVLDHPVLRDIDTGADLDRPVFQSLLCWITQSFNTCTSGSACSARVSIPVVLDHPVLQ